MALLKLLPSAEAPVSFERTLSNNKLEICRKSIEVLQVNIGKFCNLACQHCHVEAGPKRSEMMTLKTTERILHLLSKAPGIQTVDITGGAPELHPTFRYLVEESFRLKKTIIDRCNLTVFFEEGQADLLDFLKKHKVCVVASLPCYSKENVDQQRGSGTFEQSIEALKMLNSAGYGKTGTGLTLDLVYNPLGASLPPDQKKLEIQYKQNLKDWFNIDFNSLYAITNMPIKRFMHFLNKNNQLEEYMQVLLDNFNLTAAENVMCTNLLSVSWDGKIYDCDFNQMLNIDQNWQKKTVFEISSFNEISNQIAFADHCYGCTAGAGSSCSGVLV